MQGGENSLEHEWNFWANHWNSHRRAHERGCPWENHDYDDNLLVPNGSERQSLHSVVKDKASILSQNQSHDPIYDCPPEQPCECVNDKEELVDLNEIGRKKPALMTMQGSLASLWSFNIKII